MLRAPVGRVYQIVPQAQKEESLDISILGGTFGFMAIGDVQIVEQREIHGKVDGGLVWHLQGGKQRGGARDVRLGHR